LEYPGWGDRLYAEPSLKVTLADGVRDLVLKYDSQQIEGNTLRLKCKDIKYNLAVTLTYRVYPDEDIIRKSSTIENHTNQVVTLESAQSGVWYLPRNEQYRLTYAAGRWAEEDQLQQEPIRQGKVVLESRRGNTSHQLYPWFAIDKGVSDEQHGQVWFGALGWSGNWKMVVEETPMHQVRVTGGSEGPFLQSDQQGKQKRRDCIHIDSKDDRDGAERRHVRKKNVPQFQRQRGQIREILSARQQAIPAQQSNQSRNRHGIDDKEVFVWNAHAIRVKQWIAAEPLEQTRVFTAQIDGCKRAWNSEKRQGSGNPEIHIGTGAAARHSLEKVLDEA
jgi:hypothetical protein